MDAFTHSPGMVGSDNAFCLDQVGQPSLFELFVHDKAHAEVGVSECARPVSWKKELFFLKEGSPEDRPLETVPGSPPITWNSKNSLISSSVRPRRR